MADDREILREVWDGRLPVAFTLSMDELYTMEQPDTYYMVVPRQSYFPLVTDKVLRHFIKHVDPSLVEAHAEMWLEFESIPLKWHYPIGALYDMYCPNPTLPWSITVHFQNFPDDDILHCPGRQHVESHFMSTVKEADALKHKSQVINGMQKNDHKQLWMGLQNDRFEQFWGVNRKLMEESGDETFRYIPYRLYERDRPYIQKLVRPVTDTGQPHTLQDLLQHSNVQDIRESKKKVLIQGISPPLDTRLLWLSEHLSYPDNFLHICLVDEKS